MKKKIRKAIIPGFYYDRKEGHTHFFFTGGTSQNKLEVGDELFILSQIIFFDEKLEIASPQKKFNYIPYEVFVSRLDSRYRFRYLSQRERNTWPKWSRCLQALPGVLYDEHYLIKEISKLPYHKVSSFLLALGFELRKRAKKEKKTNKYRFHLHLKSGIDFVMNAGLDLALLHTFSKSLAP